MICNIRWLCRYKKEACSAALSLRRIIIGLQHTNACTYPHTDTHTNTLTQMASKPCHTMLTDNILRHACSSLLTKQPMSIKQSRTKAVNWLWPGHKPHGPSRLIDATRLKSWMCGPVRLRELTAHHACKSLVGQGRHWPCGALYFNESFIIPPGCFNCQFFTVQDGIWLTLCFIIRKSTPRGRVARILLG